MKNSDCGFWNSHINIRFPVIHLLVIIFKALVNISFFLFIIMSVWEENEWSSIFAIILSPCLFQTCQTSLYNRVSVRFPLYHLLLEIRIPSLFALEQHLIICGQCDNDELLLWVLLVHLRSGSEFVSDNNAILSD